LGAWFHGWIKAGRGGLSNAGEKTLAGYPECWLSATERRARCPRQLT
jgi:hypothetical protein